MSEKEVMRAQVIEDYCEDPDFILRNDMAIPEMTKGNQVLVNVKAASVNPGDNHLRSGHVRLLFKLKFPCILGLDASGVVTKVGADVTRFKVGDEVVGSLSGAQTGTCAEYCLFDEDDLIIKPKEMTHLQAAAFPTVGGTVIEMYKKHPLVAKVIEEQVEKYWNGQHKAEEGEQKVKEKKSLSILIIGASGGTGMVAVLFARLFLAIHFNIKVYAVCSEKNVEAVRSLGADHVIDYTKTSAKGGSDSTHSTSKYSSLPSICQTIKKDYGQDHIDFVLDCAGGYYFYDDVSQHFDCRKSIPYTVFACIVPPGPQVINIGSMFRMGGYLSLNWLKSFRSSYPRYFLVSFFGKQSKSFHFLMHHVLEQKQSSNYGVDNQKDKKGFECIPLTYFPLSDLAKAHQIIATKRTVGKIVIDI